MQFFHVTCFLVILSLFSLNSTAGVYRWVDDQGNVVYSQTPPPDGRETKLMAPPPPPAEDPDAAMERIRAQSEALEKASQERQKQQQEKKQKAQLEAQRKANCEAARKNLETLRSRPPNTLYRTGKDEYRRFTIDELNQQIKEQEKIIQENCN